MTGTTEYRNNAASVLAYNFLYDNPSVSSSGIATSWSPIYTLVGEEASLQRIEDRVALTLFESITNPAVVRNIEVQALTITRFNNAVAAQTNAVTPATLAVVEQAPLFGVGDAALEAVLSETFSIRQTSQTTSNEEPGVLRLQVPGFVNIGLANPEPVANDNEQAPVEDAATDEPEDDDLQDETIPLAVGNGAVEGEQVSQLTP